VVEAVVVATLATVVVAGVVIRGAVVIGADVAVTIGIAVAVLSPHAESSKPNSTHSAKLKPNRKWTYLIK
jgi:hypothetical protein